MVDKLSLNIKVPSLNIEHNFLIPAEMEVSVATALVVQTLLEEYPGVRAGRPTVAPRLMRMASGELLSDGASFRQLGIAQGEKLILI